MPLTHVAMADLRRAPMFVSLSEAQWAQLGHDATRLELGRGEDLPTASPRLFCLIRSGVVRVYTATPNAVTSGFLRRGHLVGDVTARASTPVEAAQVHERSTVIAIPAATLEQLAGEHRAVARALADLQAGRVSRLQRLVTRLAIRSAAERVARLLAELVRDHGIADGRGVMLPFHLSQRDLAHCSALTRETVNAAFAALRRRGLVSMDRRRIRVASVDALDTAHHASSPPSGTT